VFPRTPQQRQIELERRLIRGEAQIGGKLFGPVPKGHSRQFFCLDEHTWIWHEEWIVKGRRHAVTTRYRARPNGVGKIQNGRTTRLSVQEARHLYKAIELYQQKVHADYELKMQMV
jgi:hypothetical protein